MTEPRRHHLLPRFYLRLFADERERMTVVPRAGANGPQTTYTATVENVLVERDYYAIRDEEGERSQVVEEALGRLEGAAATAVRALLDEGLVLSDELRAAWSEFMAVEVTRGRQFRESLGNFTSEVARSMLEVTAANAPDEYFAQMSAEMVARGDEPLPDSPEEIRRALTNREAYEIVPSQEYLIELSLASVRELTNIFFQMSWKLLRFGEDCLFTCDHPVIYWRRPQDPLPFSGIGPITSDEVRVPLSPRTALILVHPMQVEEVEDAEYGAGETVARTLNRDVLFWPSSRQWLMRPGVRHTLPGAVWREWGREWLEALDLDPPLPRLGRARSGGAAARWLSRSSKRIESAEPAMATQSRVRSRCAAMTGR